MDKQLIEQLLTEAESKVWGTVEQVVYVVEKYIARIDAERGKDAAVSEMVRTAPERIWLQVSDEPDDIDDPFPRPITDEMTWSTGQCVACEVEYVRADLSPTIPEGMAYSQQAALIEKCEAVMQAMVDRPRSHEATRLAVQTLAAIAAQKGSAV